MEDQASASVSEKAASEEMSPEHRERLRAAVGILVGYILDNAPPNCHNEIGPDAEPGQATRRPVIQLRLDL